jgi:endo-beta-N-acetylglucosaminidase D
LAQVHANWLSAVAGIVISSCRWIFASFTERENIEILFSNASLRLCLSKCQDRGIDRFVRQLEGAEMHPQAATRLQVLMRANRFLWVYMVPAREPSWFVSSDGEKREIDAWESPPNLSEVWAVAGITCEIDYNPSHLDDEPAPKAMVEIVEPA